MGAVVIGSPSAVVVHTDAGSGGVVGRGRSATGLLIDKHGLLTACVAGEDFIRRIVAK